MNGLSARVPHIRKWLRGSRSYLVLSALGLMLGMAVLTASDRETTIPAEKPPPLQVYTPSVITDLRVPSGFHRTNNCPAPQSPPHACFLERGASVLNQAEMNRFVAQTGATLSHRRFEGCSGPLRRSRRRQGLVSCAAYAKVGGEEMWLFAEQPVVLTHTSFVASRRAFARLSPGIHVEVVGIGTCVKYCER